MGSVRAKESGKLFFDFRYMERRCREVTSLDDTPANRKKLEGVLSRIEAEILLNQFDYAAYFPNSGLLQEIRLKQNRQALRLPMSGIPTFAQFASTWANEKEVDWRDSYKRTIKTYIETYILPGVGEMPLDAIKRETLLGFRAELARRKGKRTQLLSPATINRCMTIIKQILTEGCLRYELPNPTANIKRVKTPRSHVEPFTLPEARQIIEAVRGDFRNYLIVRFFTGLRSGEANGLKWKFIDFERRQILVRETFVDGKTEYTKTDGSQREIDMSQVVFDALKAQHNTADMKGDNDYVFCFRGGLPIYNKNFVNRIWNPLFEDLQVTRRRPYNMRHTAATLWISSGEAPEWVAKQLGHTTTEMLFKVYSRYVPNLTRRDGAAFDRMLQAQSDTTSNVISLPTRQASGG